MQINNKYIEIAKKHYEYNTAISIENNNQEFINDYSFSFKNYKKNKYCFKNFVGILGSFPNDTHIAAKKFLFQKNDICWKYFERTAVFWAVSHIRDPWIDHLKEAFEYALFVERDDILKMLLKKCEEYLKSNEVDTKDFKTQEVYPSTYLIHFLVGKWLGDEHILNEICKYGKGYQIYDKIIKNWNDLSNIDPAYWDELYNYHLERIGLKGDRYAYEEFLGSGLVPMEIINIIKVRQKLNLDLPDISHKLSQTPMYMLPKLPSGYNENKDLKYVMVMKTADVGVKYTFSDAEKMVKGQFGEDVEIFI